MLSLCMWELHGRTRKGARQRRQSRFRTDREKKVTVFDFGSKVGNAFLDFVIWRIGFRMDRVVHNGVLMVGREGLGVYIWGLAMVPWV